MSIQDFLSRILAIVHSVLYLDRARANSSLTAQHSNTRYVRSRGFDTRFLAGCMLMNTMALLVRAYKRSSKRQNHSRPDSCELDLVSHDLTLGQLR